LPIAFGLTERKEMFDDHEYLIKNETLVARRAEMKENADAEETKQHART